jgi:signal transduction histidine kinase
MDPERREAGPASGGTTAQGTGRERRQDGDQAPDAPPASRRVVRLRLIDSGIGIPREVLPRLFDPFFTTRPGGTGLGLSISQSILQEQGGAISIASREGRGTTVVVELPLEKRHGQRRQDAR